VNAFPVLGLAQPWDRLAWLASAYPFS